MLGPVVARPLPPSEPDKQVQKAILKRIVDPAGPYVRLLQDRHLLHRRARCSWVPPTMAGALQMLPAQAYANSPSSSILTKYVHTSNNRTRCAVNCVNWTREGRRCMTGDNIGQLTLWNSSDFKFEQLFQAHDKGLRYVRFNHNGNFLFSSDDSGIVRVFNSKLAPLSKIAAHQESCRAVATAPSDVKFATCSDDQTVKIWDLATCVAEKVFTGHGSDVKHVDWHPSNSLLASCGRDGLIKLWDARQEPRAAGLITLHGHKAPINQVKWNLNGSWLLSCSRDQTVKVWDIRHAKREMSTWQGHTREVYCAAWHPIHLNVLASGGGDGALIFWIVGQAQAVAKVEGAHEGSLLGLAFHPAGHMLATCAIEACTKFWVRPRPGDPWRDAVQREQEEASSYADLLATATATAAATASAAGGAAGAAAVPGLGIGVPAQLPGGIAVQLPGIGATGGLGSIPGLGLPAVPAIRHAAAPGLTARPPGIRPPKPPAGAPPPGGPAATAAGGAALPPGLSPRHTGGLPGLAPGMQQGVPPVPVPAAAAAAAAGGGGGTGAAVLPMKPAGPHAQQQEAGFKRQRESDSGSYNRGPGFDAAAGPHQQLYRSSAVRGRTGPHAYGPHGRGGPEQYHDTDGGYGDGGGVPPRGGSYGHGFGQGFGGTGDPAGEGRGLGGRYGGRVGYWPPPGRGHDSRGGRGYRR